MRLRRVSEHVRNQNWTAIFFDLIIVVTGVFLGLQAQQWTQHRADRAQEAIFIERLITDFDAIDRELNRCLTLYRDGLNAIATVARTVASPEGGDAPPDISTELVQLTAGMLPAGRSLTFVEMVSSGDLNLLRDGVLRNSLVAYDQRALINLQAWHSVQRIAEAYQRPLYGHIVLDIDLDGELTSRVARYDIEGMRNDPDFAAMLNMQSGAKANHYELCRDQMALADSVRDLLTP